jgi:RND family efflux transporter MFP subunit
MFSKIKKIPKWITSHKIISILILAIIVLVIYFILKSNSSDSEFIELQPRDFVRTVSVVGTVKPAEDVELGFESSGRISNIYKNVGDKVNVGETLASLNAGDVRADYDKAVADLNAEKAKLNELSGIGGVQSTKTLTYKLELIQAIQDAYSDSDDAIRNKIDQFFENGRTYPDIIFAFDDFRLKEKIDDSRKKIERILVNWQAEVSDIDKDSYTEENIILSENNLYEVRNFLTDVAFAVNDFQTDNSDLTTTEITQYKNATAEARNQINTAISNLISAKENLRGVNSELPYQEAKVKAAEAVVRNYSAQIVKAQIVAPFTGIITRRDFEIGESVSSGDIVIALISASNYQIETYIPEVNIKDVKVGDIAKINLDAFPQDEFFDAKAISIDPAETVKDGVSTYKVIFEFIQNDERIKSGMTANVVITTLKKENTLLLPSSSIIKKGDYSFVKVKIGKSLVEKQVTLGSFDKSGDVEIIAGLSKGEIIVKDPNISE